MTTRASKVQAGIYCRISDDRTGAGLGVERQRKDCVRLAAQLGWAVADTYIDNDISAYSGKRRPEYDRLLTDIAHGKVTGLITWHPDRLNRSPLELERLIDVLERYGVSVQSVTAGFLDLATPSGRAVARTLGAWARFESEHKSERIIAKKLELALAGKFSPSGHRAYGHSSDGQTLIDAEAAIVREIMKRFLGGQSIGAITTWLASDGITTTNGNRWTSHHVERLLVGGRIAGWRDHPVRVGTTGRTRGLKFLAQGDFPAIVSKRSVQRARALLEDDTIRPGSAQQVLLTGLIRCGQCGTAMASQLPGAVKRRYLCGSRHKYDRCTGISIVARVEDDVTKRLIAAVADGLLERLVATGADQYSVAAQAERDVLHRIRKSRRDYLEGTSTYPEFLSRRTSLGHQARYARHATHELEVVNLNELAAADFPQTWDGLTMRYKRGIIRALTSEIVISPRTTGVNVYDPDRITTVWRA